MWGTLPLLPDHAFFLRAYFFIKTLANQHSVLSAILMSVTNSICLNALHWAKLIASATHPLQSGISPLFSLHKGPTGVFKSVLDTNR
jgi:hypothetical protein